MQNTCFFAEHTFVLAKGYNHICSASPTKKVTWRGRGAGVKNKFQGAGPFLGWIHADDLRRLARQEKVASPGQPSIDRKWWVKFNNFVSTRANIAKPAFCLRIHLSMQKGANTYVQLRQHKKWAGNVRIHDLICSRRGLFAKVVILAAQKIVNTWFNSGGCEIAVSPKASNS